MGNNLSKPIMFWILLVWERIGINGHTPCFFGFWMFLPQPKKNIDSMDVWLNSLSQIKLLPLLFTLISRAVVFTRLQLSWTFKTSRGQWQWKETVIIYNYIRCVYLYIYIYIIYTPYAHMFDLDLNTYMFCYVNGAASTWSNTRGDSAIFQNSISFTFTLLNIPVCDIFLKLLWPGIIGILSPILKVVVEALFKSRYPDMELPSFMTAFYGTPTENTNRKMSCLKMCVSMCISNIYNYKTKHIIYFNLSVR